MSDAPPESKPAASAESSEEETGEDSGRDEGDAANGPAEEEFTQDPDQVVADGAPSAGDDPSAPADQADLEELRRQIYELNDANSQIKDLARRLQADLANMRRRVDTERQNLKSRLIEEVCGHFLPVLDDLHRAAAEAARREDDGAAAGATGESGESGAAASADEALRTGVRLVLRRFEETLARQGLVEIEALGRPFDPRQHEAVHQLPAEAGQQDDEVVEVFRRGYVLDGRVIRPASVVVAVGPPPEETGPGETGPEETAPEAAAADAAAPAEAAPPEEEAAKTDGDAPSEAADSSGDTAARSPASGDPAD